VVPVREGVELLPCDIVVPVREGIELLPCDIVVPVLEGVELLPCDIVVPVREGIDGWDVLILVFPVPVLMLSGVFAWFPF